MRKKRQLENYTSLKDIDMVDLPLFFSPLEFSVMLIIEDYSTDVDIMLENMLGYFIENEFYEYAAVVRDEIKRRDDLSVKINA